VRINVSIIIYAQKGLKLANSATDITLVSGLNCLLSLFRNQNYTLGCDEQ